MDDELELEEMMSDMSQMSRDAFRLKYPHMNATIDAIERDLLNEYVSSAIAQAYHEFTVGYHCE